MNSETFDNIAYPLSSLYSKLELELMLSIARRIRQYQEMSGSIEWEMQMLAELGGLQQENVQTVARVLAGSDERLREIIAKAAEDALALTEPLMQKGVEAGALPQTVPVAMSDRLQSVYRSYYAQAAEKLNLTNTTMLSSAHQAYRNIINRTTLKVASGQTSHAEALKQTVKEFAEAGIPSITDAKGRQWGAEGYVNMVIRSTTNNTAREATFARMGDYGNDLFFISQHSGARPLCAPYQNILCSRSGRSGVANDLNGNPIRYIPLTSTSYGEPAGIFGINCGHYPIPFVEGVGTKPEMLSMADNEQQYKESQRQRALERRIRKAKGQVAVQNEAGQYDLADQSKSRLRDAQAAMREFIKQTGRTRRRDREQIY